jgi:hypothetical protein
LPVAVHGDDDIALRVVDARGERRCLSEIAFELEKPNGGIGGGNGFDFRRRAVG